MVLAADAVYPCVSPNAITRGLSSRGWFCFFFLCVSSCTAVLVYTVPAAMYTIGNVYIIAAVAVIGGGLFGFDISSMSAIIGMKLE